MTDLLLSLFPGIGLLDKGFEDEGFVVVRGPDLLWGGNIKKFHVPPGRFDGIIGGPPCQCFSRLTALVRYNGYKVAENLIPEFERVVSESQPKWFLMENVKGSPAAEVDGYNVHAAMFDNRWIGGEQSRAHLFSFGRKDARAHLDYGPECGTLENPDWSPRCLASGGGSSGCLGPRKHNKDRTRARHIGRKTKKVFEEYRRLQGLPDDWDIPGFTVQAKIQCLGNAVPYPMARALARTVKRALKGGA